MFKVQFAVSAARLEKLLEASFELGIKQPEIEHYRAEVTQVTEAKLPVAGRARDDDIMSLTQKRPKKASVREKVVVTLEKLEAKHGVGEVTRKMLRDRCIHLGIETQILYQLMREGYVTRA